MEIKNTLVLSIIILFFSVHSSCVRPEKVRPDLPPAESILIDLLFFEQNEEVSSYYNDASEKIAFWQILFNDSFSFQKELLLTALDNNLVYQAEQIWLTSDELIYNDESYDILLFCINETDTVNTKLYFSLDTTYIDLLTYDGISFENNSGGNWTVNKPDTSNTYIKFFNVDWSIKSNENIEIKFTNLLLGQETGDYILFKDSTDNNYNSYIDLFDKANENHSIIQWNSITYIGRIKDEDMFGDTDWYCWDENFSDVDCE